MKRKKILLAGEMIALALVLGVALYFRFQIKADVQNGIPFVNVVGLEETASADWSLECYQYWGTENSNRVNYLSFSPNTARSGSRVDCAQADFSKFTIENNIIKFSGDAAGRDREYRIVLNNQQLSPETKYKISYKLKYENRKCYDIWPDANYPQWIKDNYHLTRKENNQTIDGAVFCGYEDFGFKDSTNPIDVAYYNPWQNGDWNPWNSSSFVREANRDWFQTETTFTSGKQTDPNTPVTLDLMFRAIGFDGTISLDGITIESIKSFVTEDQLRVPVVNTPMRIVDSSVSQIETNAGKYSITDQSIFSVKDGDQLAGLKFESDTPGFLNGLTEEKGDGYTVLKNGNVSISFGADSTAIIKVNENYTGQVNLKLSNSSGQAPGFHRYKDGLLFLRESDAAKPAELGDGIFFMPVLGDADYRNYTLENTSIPTPPADAPNSEKRNGFNQIAHLKSDLVTWTPDAPDPINGADWQLNYPAKAGDSFIMSIFPPKDFDLKSFCQNNVHLPDFYPAKHDITRVMPIVVFFSNNATVANLHHGRYDRPRDVLFDDPDLLKFFFPDGSQYMSNLEGPFEPIQPINGIDTLALYKDAMNQFGVKVLDYLGPPFLRDQNETAFLQNVQDISNYNDGVYLDGYYDAGPVRNLEHVRKTRALIGNKFYVQHATGNTWFEDNRYYLDSDFQLPFLDAYADWIWTGESQRWWTDSIVANRFTGYGISNTPTELLAENRLIPGAQLVASQGTPVTPEDQASQLLALYSKFRIAPSSNQFDALVVDRVPNAAAYFSFDPWNYFQQIQNLCLPVIKDDGVCDANEDYLNDSNDCAPPKENVTISKTANQVTASSDEPLANWLINGNPLFDLRYQFDDDEAITDSGPYNLDPRSAFSTSSSWLLPTYETDTDGNGSVRFNGSSQFVTGFHGNKDNLDHRYLNMTRSDFSVFGMIKKQNKDDGKLHVIYSQGGDFPDTAPDDQFYFGIRDNPAGTEDTLEVSLKVDGSQQICQSGQVSGPRTVIDENWRMVGFVYDKETKVIEIYIDGQRDSSCLINGAIDPFVDYHFAIGGRAYCSGTNCTASNPYNYSVANYFAGNMADLFVAKQALDPATIGGLYSADSKDYLKKYISPDNQKIVNIKAVMSSSPKKYNSAEWGAKLSISADKKFIHSGSVLTYSVQYTNPTEETLFDLAISLPVPSGTNYTEGSASNGGQYDGGKVIWQITTLEPGQLINASFQVKIK